MKSQCGRCVRGLWSAHAMGCWPGPQVPGLSGSSLTWRGAGLGHITECQSNTPPLSLSQCTDVHYLSQLSIPVLRSGLGNASSYLFGVRVKDLRKMICSLNITALFVCSHSECQEACCHYPLITTNKLSFNCHKFNQQQSHKSVCYGTPGTRVRDSRWEDGGHDRIESEAQCWHYSAFLTPEPR